ncbi:uncharacterized protein [Paramormyrops kingsleyae]|uniref:uncharacterized protein isoform X2 n=1 Tax=Paramormyrops kingsleyae TaxID=1676925 RepID=UPI003B979BF0
MRCIASEVASIGMLLPLLLCASVVAGISPGVNISFIKGAAVVLVGTEVQMMCHSWSGSQGPPKWYRLTPHDGPIVMSGDVLNLHNVTVEDSGSYACTYTTILDGSQPVNLTVIEVLPPVTVAATPSILFVFEGQTLTLRCLSASGVAVSPLVVWSWERLGVNASESVGSGQELSLSTMGQSGNYHCQAHLSLEGIKQLQTSEVHAVHILPQPGLLTIGIAAFALVLLAWTILLLILLYLYVGRAKASKALTQMDRQAPPGGLPESLTCIQTVQGPMAGGDIYINCKELAETYCDLNPSRMEKENFYGKLT